MPLTKAGLLDAHAGDRVGFDFADHIGYAVVRRDAGPSRWVGGGRMVDVALYIRRDRGRPAADFGPMALMRIAPRDEWERASADEESRYFARHPPYCWTGDVIAEVRSPRRSA